MGGPASASQSTGNLHKLPGLTGADKINLLNGGTCFTNGGGPGGNSVGSGGNRSGDYLSASSSGNVLIDKDGTIEIPGKGWCFVYVARYSYDPFQHSPNDSPEAELQVSLEPPLNLVPKLNQFTILCFPGQCW